MTRKDAFGNSYMTVGDLQDVNMNTAISKVATVALWNLLTKNEVIDGTDETLTFLRKWAPEQFEELCQAPKPVFGYKN